MQRAFSLFQIGAMMSSDAIDSGPCHWESILHMGYILRIKREPSSAVGLVRAQP